MMKRMNFGFVFFTIAATNIGAMSITKNDVAFQEAVISDIVCKELIVRSCPVTFACINLTPVGSLILERSTPKNALQRLQRDYAAADQKIAAIAVHQSCSKGTCRACCGAISITMIDIEYRAYFNRYQKKRRYALKNGGMIKAPELIFE